MSSASTEASTTNPVNGGRETYWCHECDMSVTLVPSPNLLCPHCHHDFLELMDRPSPTAEYSDLIEFHRLIHQFSEPTTSTNSNAASRISVESLPTITITPSLIGEVDDGLMFCAICKDQFVIDSVGKELPCKHIYHPDCILPWLSSHNSCPLCRFKFPVEQRQPEIDDLFRDSDPDYMRFLGSLGGFEWEMLARRDGLANPNWVCPDLLRFVGRSTTVDGRIGRNWTDHEDAA
ncbi:E3 ubiquitin-protein ligase RING1-like [Tripterygium wilfordii]|uniref:RING-type E3 ubiquitin transferase n=1 Tax=Tripterygium wilfordii TaxID=458696 RepID=A0A7J7CQR1_TRIWF|nr:RING-H2 finger protein ATL43 [Tripterygium wilfordii]XP_038722287.1 RING-H2 finger protein ATL43 [Tripterygium wilfordii]KAF5736391.1 E3 ubiquitin-protein ligase RING1-like [Tripterygium wilfordii]